jgi:hypothetical protein
VCTGLSGEPTEQRSTTPNGRLCWRRYSEQCRSQKSELPSQNTPDCLMPQEDKGLQRSTAPNPNGRLTWHAPDSEQCHVRCTTRLSSVLIDSNGWISGWGYKYPNHHHSSHPSLHIFTFNTRAKANTPKTQSKHSIPSKLQNQLNYLET